MSSNRRYSLACSCICALATAEPDPARTLGNLVSPSPNPSLQRTIPGAFARALPPNSYAVGVAIASCRLPTIVALRPGIRRFTRLSLLALACTTATLTSACASAGKPNCRSNEQAAVVDSLYFGTAMPRGSVSQQDWQSFLAEVITPRFPEGLTAWAAAGQWRNSAGELQKEESYVLHVVHGDEAKYDAAVHDIVEVYKSRFHQEAVLRVRTPTCISF